MYDQDLHSIRQEGINNSITCLQERFDRYKCINLEKINSFLILLMMDGSDRLDTFYGRCYSDGKSDNLIKAIPDVPNKNR